MESHGRGHCFDRVSIVSGMTTALSPVLIARWPQRYDDDDVSIVSGMTTALSQVLIAGRLQREQARLHMATLVTRAAGITSEEGKAH